MSKATNEVIDHIKSNEEIFRFWIDRNEHLQYSADILKPLIEPFTKEFPSVNVESGCKECLIDMLRWAVSLLKPSKEEEIK